MKKASSFTTLLLFICLMLVGLAFMPLLTVKLSPSRALPQVTVSFSMPGSSARMVEMEVTSKLEGVLSRIKGVESVSSTSSNGGGSVQLRLNKHTNIEMARFEASSIIRQTYPLLPQEVRYPTVSVRQSGRDVNLPFLSYTINAPTIPIAIQQYAETYIQPLLSQIEGVSSVSVSGATPMEWEVEYDLKQLESLGLRVSDIQSAVSSYLTKESLGIASVENERGERQWIRIALTAEPTHRQGINLKEVIVKNVNGKLILLGEIAAITYRESQARGYYRINGLNSIYLSIVAEEDANQLALAKKVKDKLSELRQLLPTGYELHLSYDATEYIHDELTKIYFRSGLTLLILLLFVLLAYRSLKYLFLIAFSLVANIAIALLFYYLFGVEIHLYSLAGITISLSLIIDNTIVMSDQILNRGNRKAFLAIFTATITTVAALIVVLWTKVDFWGFAHVIVINLSVSLLIALFLVPALLEKLNIGKKDSHECTNNFLNSCIRGVKKRRWRRLSAAQRMRLVIRFNRAYARFCRFTWRRRVWVLAAVVLIFGLPVFLLPDKVKGEGRWHEFYNSTLGATTYKEKIKPYVDVALGGTLRLFLQKTKNDSYFTEKEETSLFVTATLPNGSTVEQMNSLVQRMESYISQFAEVRQFQTSIESAYRASISIQFTKESQHSSFPFLLKSKLISRALELGGGSWSVVGLGDGFNNSVRESAGSSRVQLFGFNYDELVELANKFKERLLSHRRIKDVIISSEFSYFKDDYMEFVFSVDKQQLAQLALQPSEMFATVGSLFRRSAGAGQMAGEYGMESIVLNSRQSKEYDVWSLDNLLNTTGESTFKLSALAAMEKSQTPQKIAKERQQYRLCLQYEYIGSVEQSRRVLEQNIKEFEEELPLGYTIEDQNRYGAWGGSGGKASYSQLWLLMQILLIIYFACSILFNSLKQPFSILFVVPIAFIGIFLVFYLFNLSFDQGGLASFVLICGITVNANIYLLNEYNNIRAARKIRPIRAYLKAWNAKIYPILLTVVSTMLGFIPFMVGEHQEAFWFSLAVGTIGGLTMSLVGTFLLLPMFMGVGRRKKSRR